MADIQQRIVVDFKTIQDARRELIAFNEVIKKATVGSAEFNAALAGRGAVKQWISDVQRTTAVLPQLTTGTANAGVALQNLNFVIRDSPYFFRDFSLGILAVGNNLNPLIDSMQRLKAEAAGVNQTLGQALVAALKGPAGVVLAFSALVTILQAVVFAMAKTKNEADDTKKSIDALSSAVDKLLKVRSPFSSIFFDLKPEDLDNTIRELDAIIQKGQITSKILQTGATVGTGETRVRIDTKELVKDTKDKIELDSKVIEKLKEEKTQLEAQRRVYELLKSLGIDIVNKEKDKTKELEKQLKITGGDTTLEASAKRVTFFGAATGTGQTERQNLVQPSLNRPSATLGKTLADNFKQVNKELNIMKQIADDVGDALVNAFMQGKVQVEDFLKSLGAAILKMFILNLFSGGTGIGGAVAMGTSAAPFSVSPMTSNFGNMGNNAQQPIFVFENVIDGQKIIYKGIKEKQAVLR